MHTRASNSELVEPLLEPERTLNQRRHRQNRRVPFDQRNNQSRNSRIVYPPILDINHFRHFLVTLENLYPMDDEPMWAADRVVALTPGFVITILETANEFAIKEVLNAAAGGIILYKTPNQAYQLLEDKVLLKLDWAKNQKNKSSLKKTISFVDKGSSNSNTDRIIAQMDAMTLKMDAQYKELQTHAKKTKPDLDEDDIPMSRKEEAKFIQTFRSDDEIPPPPPPPQTPTQQAPHTVSTIKLPILKKGEYDIWAMKMEHYLSHTDYPIWEVIQKGNGPVSVSTDTNGVIKVLPPKTAEEILARERERKARTTLLMALPEDHLAKFHKMTDAKDMWDAIKSRFGGNDESKKMQKYILKQQFEGFSVSNSEGLHKGYDRFQSLLSQLEIHGAGVSTEDANQKFLRSLPSSWSQVSLVMRTKPGVDSLSFDDLYNNLRVFESDVKGSSGSSENSSSYTNELMYSFLANQSSGPHLDYEDLEQLDEFDLEEMDLKMEEPKALVTLDGEGIDWTDHAEDEQENFALMAYNNLGSNTEGKGTGQGENRPVWNNVQRLNHQNQFVPTAVPRASSTNNVNTARHNFSSQAIPTNAARKVHTVKPIVNNVRLKLFFIKLIQLLEGYLIEQQHQE
ncbi:hypothetical protein Tco_0672285 [Tanacetum coccineum]